MTTMTNLKPLLFLLSASIIALLSSCGGTSTSEANQEASEKEFDAAEKELKSQIEEVVYDIPSPSEVPGLLQATGAEFNASLVNDLNKVDSYLSGNDKAALNLGVYSTDVGYLISYDKVQDALNFMSTSKKLAEELGLAGNFEQSLVKRFENNLSNQDSLTILLDETINNSSDYLKQTNRDRLAALILTGSLVEGLYISCQLITTYPKDILPAEARNAVLLHLIRVILQQEKSVGEVLKMLKTIEQSQPVAALTESFQKLENNYKKLNIADKIANNQGDLVINDETLKDIANTSIELRKSITD